VTDLRAADGRVPGRRGLATRTRLLECTADMLATTSFRELKVIDIAREANTSPATFYQYFPDVESAILVLAEDMVSEGAHHFADIVADAAWKSKSSYDAALSLADEILAFWDEHRVVIRVVDLATDVVESSGNRLLDRRAQAIVRSVGSFGKFTDAMRRQTDQIVLPSRFKFTHDETLETQLSSRQ